MQTKQELIDEANGWKGKNKYLFQLANDKLKRGDYSDNKPTKTLESKVSKEFKDYKNMTVIELKKIAKKLGISKYYNLKEDELIKEIRKRD